MVSSIFAPVACSRYALSGSASRAIFPGSLVGIMLSRSVLPARSALLDFEHADPAVRARAATRVMIRGPVRMAVEYHGRAFFRDQRRCEPRPPAVRPRIRRVGAGVDTVSSARRGA